MKYDITKTPLWSCYGGALEEWYGTSGSTWVEGVIYEMLDAIEEKFKLTSPEHMQQMEEVVEPFLRDLGVAFIEDVRSIAETATADVIDEVMEKHIFC